MNSPEWLRALSSASEALQAVEGLSGSSDPVGNAAFLEARDELARVVRHLSNLCVFNGVSPAEVEAAKQ